MPTGNSPFEAENDNDFTTDAEMCDSEFNPFELEIHSRLDSDHAATLAELYRQ